MANNEAGDAGKPPSLKREERLRLSLTAVSSTVNEDRSQSACGTA